MSYPWICYYEFILLSFLLFLFFVWYSFLSVILLSCNCYVPMYILSSPCLASRHAYYCAHDCFFAKQISLCIFCLYKNALYFNVRLFIIYLFIFI